MSSRGARFPLGLDKLAGGSAAVASPREPLRPQRHLHEAARDAARSSTPQGLGLDSAQVRQRMVLRLRAEGVANAAVLDAFAAVQRHRFVDSALAIQAYEDTSLPIGHGQTISKPSVVARMLGLLAEAPAARSRGHLGATLEVGTGCGYQTALLARLAPRVVSIERIGPLFDKARENLQAEDGGRPGHVRLVHGDGMLGHAPNAPYDSLIAAAGGDTLPAAWLEQLAIGGRLVAPMVRGRGQVLVVIDRDAHGWHRSEHEAVHFVPLKSGLS